MIFQRTILKKYRDKFIINVNPKFINEYVGSNIFKYPNSENKIYNYASKKLWPKNGLTCRVSPFRVYSFIIPEQHYIKPVPITSKKKYKKIYSLFQNRNDYVKSIWFREMHEVLKRKGVVYHKKIEINSEKMLHSFFKEYALVLMNSMLSDGYDYNLDQDLPNVMIGSEGEIHKSNAGDHRFIVAKLAGVELMPFKIKGIHNNFFEKKGLIKRRESLPDIISEIKRLESEYK